MQREVGRWVGGPRAASAGVALLASWMAVAACGSDRNQQERAAAPARSPSSRTTPSVARAPSAPSAPGTPSVASPPTKQALPPATPPAELGGERLVVASVALATPVGWSLHPCEDPCVIVLRSNLIAAGVMPFVKLEVMPDMPGTLAELRANGARTYSANGTIPVEQTSSRFGADPAFDLSYTVSDTTFRQVARHALRERTLFVLTASGPDRQRDAPVWRTLQGILEDARFMGPPPSAAELRRLRQVRPDLRREAARQERQGSSGGADAGRERPSSPPAGTGPAPAPPR